MMTRKVGKRALLVLVALVLAYLTIGLPITTPSAACRERLTLAALRGAHGIVALSETQQARIVALCRSWYGPPWLSAPAP